MNTNTIKHTVMLAFSLVLGLLPACDSGESDYGENAPLVDQFAAEADVLLTPEQEARLMEALEEEALHSELAPPAHDLSGCGYTTPANFCPVPNSIGDGVNCANAPAGAYCEGDGECATNNGLNNCGNFDWYFKYE